MSVLTFGVLMGSLVMLAVMPLLNQNNSFSNIAMAQGYYGDDSYSQYPTDDKKYECRTGPFEGFFVSSVEFCKHIKFDDRKDNKDRDNKTGTQGDKGPTGLTGPFYTTSGPRVLHNSSEQGIAQATCDPGDFAISGGGAFAASVDGSLEATFDFQGEGVANNTWIAGNIFNGPGLGSVDVSAICLDNPPLK